MSIIQILSAFLAPIVAFVGAVIAYQQWKFNLFNRRFLVYDAAKKFIESMLEIQDAKDREILYKSIHELSLATREAKWLVDPNIADYIINELSVKALELDGLITKMKSLNNGIQGIDRDNKDFIEKWERINENIGKIKGWFKDQNDVLDEKFDPFLNLNSNFFSFCNNLKQRIPYCKK